MAYPKNSKQKYSNFSRTSQCILNLKGVTKWNKVKDKIPVAAQMMNSCVECLEESSPTVTLL